MLNTDAEGRLVMADALVLATEEPVDAISRDSPQSRWCKLTDLVVDLLRDAGVGQLETLSLLDTAPVITGEIPGPGGAPTVLLYGHYRQRAAYGGARC